MARLWYVDLCMYNTIYCISGLGPSFFVAKIQNVLILMFEFAPSSTLTFCINILLLKVSKTVCEMK